MRKIILLLILIITGIFFAKAVFAQEKIDSFDVKIQINPDATFNVSEKIQYNFGQAQRHGIYRIIPIKYNARGGHYNLRIFDVYVTDENNQPYNFVVSYPGDNIEIRIGDANVLISGIKTYIINYKIRRAINYFNDHDELYWNVTGNEWKVPIDYASAEINLPYSISANNLQTACFRGPYGATTPCSQTKIIANGAIFEQKEYLNAYEGLTIVIGWPKGITAQPTWQRNIQDFLEDNKSLFLPIVILIVCYLYWLLAGKDPRGRKTIIAEYEPPDNLSPAEVGTIIDERTQKKDISAEIIELAIKGYLKIKREISGTIFKKPTYTLIKLKQADNELKTYQALLFNALFANNTEVKLQDLHENFYKDYNAITNDVYRSTVNNGYFPVKPNKMRLTFLIVGIIITLIFYALLNALTTPWDYISCTISIIIIIIASRFMSKKTLKGVLAKEYILGLKEYLIVAEKERIKFHNAPEKNPELFEKLLPYAMVLGVEKQWASQFKDIYKQAPKWYDSDEDLTNFNSAVLVNDLGNFTDQAHSVLFTPPASASSGSSGFSGGGSGGGFGGGGGGSW